MNALVTGGAGFIGSNITKKLVENNYNVTVLDNLSSGYIKNITKYISNGQIKFVQADICNSKMVEKACKEQDVVFHLAACVGRQKSIDNPILDASTNLLGTVNILEGMRKNAVGKIVYSSSAAIFGELLTSSIDENHPQNADSPYGVSKLAAEKMILAYTGIYKSISAVCLRYFNIYGINQRFDLYGNVIPIFAKRILSNEPITIYGDGTQTRDFVNVNDVVTANLLASKSDNCTEVYNVGSGGTITISELAKIMQKIARTKSKIIYAAERPADVKYCKANSEKINMSLGFKSKVSLEEGLTQYMEWFRNNCM